MARIALYLDPTMTTADGQFVPAIVTEGEPGYHTTTYRYGTDYDRAKAAVAEAKTQLGLTAADVTEIVASSMPPL